jgi:maleylacetoacetate isomerase
VRTPVAWGVLSGYRARVGTMVGRRIGRSRSTVAADQRGKLMRLYDYSRSPAAHRVRIALGVKGVGYEPVPVNLRRGNHRTLDYLGHNPQGLVPTLEDGELRLTQSLAIVEYIDERFPTPPLLPTDLAGRALVRSLAQHIASDIAPMGSLRVLHQLQHRLGLRDSERSSWYRYWLAEGFAALEQRLRAVAGHYCCGDELTMADVCLVPQVHQARRYDCDLAPFPLIRRIEAACMRLPAFEAARPERQLDAA